MNPSKKFHISLESHVNARDKAVASRDISPGEVIITEHAWGTALVPGEKGKRCDHCHRVRHGGRPLRRCTGCASYWYCGTACQNAGWKTSHRRICKEYNRFMVSNDWQALDAHRRTDSILLSHLMVPMSTSSEYANAWISGSRDLDRMVESPAGCLMDLMSNPTIVSLPYMGSRELDAVATSLVRKFARNNFLLHSHLNPAYAHGAYPLASRALNHSCVPNAAPRFVLQEGETPRMDVVALSKITKGEEVTIPYHDPALPFRARHEALRDQYDFICDCKLCEWSERHLGSEEKIPAPPGNSAALKSLGRAVQVFGLPLSSSEGPPGFTYNITNQPLFQNLPESLLVAMHPMYLPALSEAFSLASHGGPLVDAVEVGKTLLALYRIIYPPAFPLVGIHALELAKVCWNTALTHIDTEAEMVLQANTFLAMARTVLDIYGVEGDEGGPLAQLSALTQAMAEE